MLYIDDLLPKARKDGWICPICSSGSGDKGTGLVEDPNNKGHYKCFACDFYGDVYDVADLVNGRPKGESYREDHKRPEYRAHSVPKKPKEQQTQQTQITHEEHEAYITMCAAALPGSQGEAYLKARGFTTETIAACRLGYDAAADQVIIPYPNTDYYIGRRLHNDGNGKYYKPKTSLYGPEPIFNAAALKAPSCFATEGQLDALSIIQAGAPAFAIGGGGDKKLDDYRKLPEKITIVADNDEAGEKTARRLQEHIKARSGQAVIVHPPLPYKDVNDFLRGDPSLLQCLCRADSWEINDYKERSSAAAYIDGFWKEARNRTPATPTGFKTLDEKLLGGFFEGLIILGAVSSLGKTAFCLQIADQVAEAGQDVIIFSLEMARSELMARSLSRLSYRMSPGAPENAKTARALMDQRQIDNFTRAELDLMRRATAEYRTFAGHLWINEGLGTIGTAEIRAAVERHIEITRQRPLVIVDYLQMIASPDSRLSDKQVIDKNVFELKRISREFKIPVLAVSSFNRSNYTSSVNMSAFKESGAIEYSSDVLIGLQPKGMKDASEEDKRARAENAKILKRSKQAKERYITCSILKNRNGPPEQNIEFLYRPLFNYLEEVGPDDEDGAVWPEYEDDSDSFEI